MTDRRRFLSHASTSGLSPSLFARSDFWRGAPPQQHRLAPHKEWSHFCAVTPELDVIVNFSLMQHAWFPGEAVREIPRVTLMVRRGDGDWDGDIMQFAPDEVAIDADRTGISIGANSLRFADGIYHIDASTASGAVAARLRFRPLARPAVASSVRLSAAERMRWLVVPRLAADGEIEIGGRTLRLADAPAYHDRNWGHFRWGEDYSWEWATILPTSGAVPWSLVYMRISDGTRNRSYSQGLMVWREGVSKRVFHGADLRLAQAGWLKRERVLRLPRIVNLMTSGHASSVPNVINIEAAAWSDHVEAELSFEDVAQVGVPNDGPSGLTLLSEVTGSAKASGRIGGEPVSFEGRVLMEFKHASR